MISVIIPNFNEEKALPYFLDSLDRQQLGSMWWQLIVVDGGSTDQSREIIDSYEGLGIPMFKMVSRVRNLGYVRNLGASEATGQVFFFTNSDAVLPPLLLMHVNYAFQMNPGLQALSGRTVPYGGGALCFAAYSCFDLLRSFMANHLGRFSPSGNFLAIRAELFRKLKGFPEAPVNEDGLLGQRISRHCRENGLQARFALDLKTGHFAKRFKREPLKTLLFYSYVFGNFSPFLARLLSSVEKNSGKVFQRRGEVA